MQEGPFSRMEILFGEESMRKLSQCRVALFGVGGVGGHCAEALARCGVGNFVLVDMDRVTLTNLNRQAVALHSTMGQYKVDVMRARILDINPEATVEAIPGFYSPDNDLGIWTKELDLVIDAIDTVSAKVDLALRAQQHGIDCVSCMGAGNKLNPMGFEAADIYATSVCPLCRATRKLAREKGIERLRVVYSKEEPALQKMQMLSPEKGRPAPGSVVYVTAAAGLMMAREAVNMLLGNLSPDAKCEDIGNF